ncbi:MerR family transcriptional regulator [Enterococcus casseliflavus]|uniref:MerR family transcriptional regulator n=1 Tax=Enterococcus casseliflavus TaxID=37734 RepID=UPI003D0A935A
MKTKLKVSEMARLARINPRTLHYYDEIGLFQPNSKDENGYRYYSLDQLLDLGLILSLKELSMPLKEIQTALQGDAETMRNLLEAKRQTIDEKIQQLTNIKKIIERKAADLRLATEKTSPFTLKEQPEEYFSLSPRLNGSSIPEMITQAYDLLMAQPYLFSNNEYGSMIRTNKDDTQDIDYVYVRQEEPQGTSFVKPAGCYLTAIYQGDDEGLKQFYQKLKQLIATHQWQIDDYFYERSIHETTLSNEQAYLTEIQVRILSEE